MREYTRKWRATHPDSAREKRREWVAANPDKVREQQRRYCAANPDKLRAKNDKRRALMAGNGGSHTAEEWQALCAQYGNQCIGPGPHSGPLCRDHVIPLKPRDGSTGGTSNIDNIQPLCKACNARKSNKTIDYRGNAGQI